MYRWRKLSNDDQAALLKWRQQIKRPWHSPPHPSTGPGRYHLTAACYEHECIVGKSVDRMQAFCEDLLDRLDSHEVQTVAWCLLPNHYHLLVQVDDLKATIAGLGRLHGRTAFFWNGEDNQRGRRVWAAPADRQIRTDAYYWATVNYIHHNPVKTWMGETLAGLALQ